MKLRTNVDTIREEDPFYSESNVQHLLRAIKDLDEGKGVEHDLIEDIERNGEFDDIGKPEALKNAFSGCYSRRIDETNRLVYRINDNLLEIISCAAIMKSNLTKR